MKSALKKAIIHEENLVLKKQEEQANLNKLKEYKENLTIQKNNMKKELLNE